MKLVLDDGTENQIDSVVDVQVVRTDVVRLHLIVELKEMTQETVFEFAHKVLPGMKL
jgi:hypothetical protein